MKYYYSVESDHGNLNSRGFANDKTVLVFNSKSARDNYLANVKNISAKAIRKSEVVKSATNYSLTRNKNIKPKPFTREHWAIFKFVVDTEKWGNIEGLIGSVWIDSGDKDYGYIKPLF